MSEVEQGGESFAIGGVLERFDSRDAYLQYFRALTRSPYLHYGLWPKDLEPTLDNLVAAQGNYVDNVIRHVPRTAKSVLDVGCGPGGTARKLLDRGFEVTALTPVPWQRDLACALTEGRAEVILCPYERFRSDKMFDVILMCESAQYIDIETCLTRSRELCAQNGTLIVCDYFRIHREDDAPINKSGHLKQQFLEQAALSGFRLRNESDITSGVIQTLDLAEMSYKNTLKPTIEFLMALVGGYAGSFDGLLKPILRQIQIDIDRYSTIISPAEFMRTKKYEMLIFEAV